MSTDCSHNIGQLNINPDFSSGDYFVDKGSYDYIDSATIIKDENLIPENIKKDVTIFGITGTLESGGASLDRIAIICFSMRVRKTSSSNYTLTYDITSGMLNKTFFTDGKGNWYLAKDVSVYYRDTYKGKANTALTLFSGTETVPGYHVSFRVGTTPVALLLYHYWEGFSGIVESNEYIKISWPDGSGQEVAPYIYDMEFIELPDNFFNDFPYPHSSVDYWEKVNFFTLLNSNRTSLRVGWEFYDND
jgi:hypothetical protein